MGGYTHANYCYTDEILKNVDSYDETSAYPYVLVAYKYPSSEFQKVNIKDRKEMLKTKAYLLHVLFTHVKSKYYNNFISGSKCQRIRGAKYDNGRIISAEEIEITLTDIDFYFLLDAYYLEYEILEIYEANYAYLPHKFVDFILEKYVKKTQYKNVAGMELEYTKEKNNFNALYGMSVTNTIRDKVIYNNETKEWHEEELINDEIIEALLNEKKKGFLSFSYGVWVTAYARNNLLRRVLDLDEFVVYCDTDSIKLVSGYPKKIFEDYNKSVLNRLDRISKIRNIPVENFFPKDKDGIAHPLGIFEHEANYQEFITQGAKKYCYKENNKIAITVSGVPKKAACSLNKVSDFRDNYIFKFKDTNKNCMIYNDHQIEIELIDYQGNHEIVKDICGACLLPLNYPLRKSHDYANLLNDMSSARARFKE